MVEFWTYWWWGGGREDRKDGAENELDGRCEGKKERKLGSQNFGLEQPGRLALWCHSKKYKSLQWGLICLRGSATVLLGPG